jgi:drug/metabolite transporter (DMT)-like permease
LSHDLGAMAALGTALCWSLTPLFFSFSGRRIGSDVVNRSRLLFALAFYVFAHQILFGHPLPTAAAPWRWGWLGVSAVLGLVIGDAALFQAFVLVGPRLATLMMALSPILSTVLAWLVLGETASARELTGIALTVSGVVWVVTEPRTAEARAEGSAYRTGLLLGLIGAIGQATNLITARFGLVGDYPAVSASFIRMMVAAAILWGLSAVRGDISRIVGQWRDRRAVAAVFGGALVGPFLGVTLSLFAVQHTRIGIASTLMALPPVLLIPLEYMIHGRRTSVRGIVGTVVAFAGVALIFLRG